MTGQENNQIDHEISPGDITKWEQGGVKPEGNENIPAIVVARCSAQKVHCMGANG